MIERTEKVYYLSAIWCNMNEFLSDLLIVLLVAIATHYFHGDVSAVGNGHLRKEGMWSISYRLGYRALLFLVTDRMMCLAFE